MYEIIATKKKKKKNPLQGKLFFPLPFSFLSHLRKFDFTILLPFVFGMYLHVRESA